MKAAKPRLALSVQYAVTPGKLPAAGTLRRWARAAVERDASVTLRFVGKREGRTLNSRYRGKAHATNVLAFGYGGASRIEGDVVLCAPVLRDEARLQRKPLADHCAHLVVHAMLHLQGYDHDNRRAARSMEQRETAILASLGIADPYERAGPSQARIAPSRRDGAERPGSPQSRAGPSQARIAPSRRDGAERPGSPNELASDARR